MPPHIPVPVPPHADPPDLFTILIAEHREVGRIMSRLATSRSDLPRRKALYEELSRTLIPHVLAEEEILYTRLGGDFLTRPGSLQSAKEHREVVELLGHLGRVLSEPDGWLPVFIRFDDVLLRHVDDEELHTFPDAAALLPPWELEEMAVSYVASRDFHLAHLRPVDYPPSQLPPTTPESQLPMPR